MHHSPVSRRNDRCPLDWRCWITLAWVVFWGFSYCGMVVQARGGRVMEWFKPRESIGATAHPDRNHRKQDPAALTIESSSTTVPASVQAR
jgi:hypothetical protein